MKTLILFFTMLTLAFSAEAYGQVDRSMTGQYSGKPKKKKADTTDYLQLGVDKLTEQLNLDSFQQAVIKNLLEESQEKQMKVYESDIPTESKNEKMTMLRDKTITDIKAVLTPEQLVKYEEITKKKKKK